MNNEKRHFHCLKRATKGSDSFQWNRATGLTLIELMLVVAIIGGLTGLTIPAYTGHRDKVLVQQAVADILNIELGLDKYYAENGHYPDTLADISKAGAQDPWGNNYQYLNLANDPKQNKCRKLRNIHPINTDINSGVSWDDIIRAYDGTYVGKAQNII